MSALTSVQAIHQVAKVLVYSLKPYLFIRTIADIMLRFTHSEFGVLYVFNRKTHLLEYRLGFPYKYNKLVDTSSFSLDHSLLNTKLQTTIYSASAYPFYDYCPLEVNQIMTTVVFNEEKEPIGLMQFFNKKSKKYTSEDISVVESIMYILINSYINNHLHQELLKAASLLGMGQVAHDIKNLAYAIQANLMLSEQTLTDLRENARNIHAPSTETLILNNVEDIDYTFEELRESTNRLKRYSSLISDLSSGKIPEPTRRYAPMAQAIQLGASYQESECRSFHVGIRYEIDHNSSPTLHDEMYISRIIQNLVSNALKATVDKMKSNPHLYNKFNYNDLDDEFEEIETIIVRYFFKEGYHILEVEDHGSGMLPSTIKQILSGGAHSLWNHHSGSGWGVKIIIDLTATHQGNVEFDSVLDTGTTVRIKIPHCKKIPI